MSHRRELVGLAVAVLCITPAVAHAAPGDPRIVTGILEWPPTLTDERFLVMRAADGTRIYVDVAGAQRRTGSTLAAGDRVSAAGVEGERPYELRATVLAPGTAESPPALPAPAAPRSSASPASAPAETAERIDGRIESVTGTRLVLHRDDGEIVSVDLSRVAGNSSVGPGADVTVFGVREADGRFVATGLVGRERSEGAASPAPSR